MDEELDDKRVMNHDEKREVVHRAMAMRGYGGGHRNLINIYIHIYVCRLLSVLAVLFLHICMHTYLMPYMPCEARCIHTL